MQSDVTAVYEAPHIDWGIDLVFLLRIDWLIDWHSVDCVFFCPWTQLESKSEPQFGPGLKSFHPVAEKQSNRNTPMQIKNPGSSAHYFLSPSCGNDLWVLDSVWAWACRAHRCTGASHSQSLSLFIYVCLKSGGRSASASVSVTSRISRETPRRSRWSMSRSPRHTPADGPTLGQTSQKCLLVRSPT